MDRGEGAVRTWLWLVAGLVFAMVLVGGATRLTESGLSITEWKPIAGAIPPLGEADWQAAFEKYRQIPQYARLNAGMGIEDFKTIFLWEWAHRFLGRVIGLAFAVPLAVFWARGQVPARLKLPLLGLLCLGALQGAVGWWMVASGLVDRTEVAQERLAIHLLLASVTFAAIVWIASGIGRGKAGPTSCLPALVLALVLAQIALGGLVAGLRAGLTYNTWPLMDGRLVPAAGDLFALVPAWRNVVYNVALVQFQHRLGAYALLAVAVWNAWRAPPALRAGARALAALVATQAAIGIATLLLVVPLWAGLLHQGFAMVVVAMASVHACAAWPRASARVTVEERGVPAGAAAS